MKLLQINECLNGSTGKIARQIGDLAIDNGWDSYIAYSAWENEFPCKSKLIKIGSKYDRYFHALETRLRDNHGLASRRATKKLVETIQKLTPDIIHLHNIHGYYLNYPILFRYLREKNIPVVWTLHDCWSFTGHCSHFDAIKCFKWREKCRHCQGLNTYPKSLWIDRSEKNYLLKKEHFTAIADCLTIVPVSYWLENFVQQSFLKDVKVQTIHNGIDIDTFRVYDSDKVRQKYKLDGKFVVLGVAAPWTQRKGLNDFITLRQRLPHDKYAIMLVGLTKKQIKKLPNGIIGITRTDSPQELAEIYSMADVFFNPTYEDNYPTVNLEAIACGTPVVTYDTGGCAEAISAEAGWVVQQGKMSDMVKIINNLALRNENEILTQRMLCRYYAEKNFKQTDCFRQYISLYEYLINYKR